MRGSFSASAMEQPPRANLPRRGCLIIVPLIGGALLLLVAVALILFLGLRPVLFPAKDETNSGMPLEVVKLTPPVPPATPVSPLPLPQQTCETIISSDNVQVAASLPVSLTVGGEPFPVVAIVSEEEGWTYPSGYPGTAAWVCGTVVNYVVGMEATPANEAMLVGLRPGDELKMRLSNGVVLFFRFIERRETEANEARVFEQVRPRLTLVLEKEDGNWQVATADYVSETEPVQPPAGTLVQSGQPVRVGDAQVTVVEAHVERSGPDLLPDTMYYLVEFAVENVGTTPLDTTAFNMQLQDDVGSVYLLSPEASTAGRYGPLSGEIGAGTTMQATAGYLVPETLAGPALIWTFTPHPASELRASVSIPYTADAETSLGGHAKVTIDEDATFLSSNSSNLVIGGEIRNTGDEALTVELGDISLTSSAGMSALSSAAPPLPWTIQPGQAQIIELQYEKPDASTVLLTLMGYSFEIRGVQ